MALTTKTSWQTSPKIQHQFHMHNGEVYARRHVHKFNMGDVEDPELYAAGPIYEWQNTEMGLWVMKHGLDPTYHTHINPMTYGYTINITAHITDRRWTEFLLRWPAP
jgi:hypothetical protein